MKRNYWTTAAFIIGIALALGACAGIPVALDSPTCDTDTYLRYHGCPANYNLGHVAGSLTYIDRDTRNWNTGN